MENTCERKNFLKEIKSITPELIEITMTCLKISEWEKVFPQIRKEITKEKTDHL